MERVLMIQSVVVDLPGARLSYMGGRLYMAADIPTDVNAWIQDGIAVDPDAPIVVLAAEPEPGTEPAPLPVTPPEDPLGEIVAGPASNPGAAGPASEGGL